MIVKSFEVKKNKANFSKKNFYLIYGENVGLKKDIKEFMDECKAKPNTLKVAFAGFGSATHLAGVAMTNLSGCKPIMLPVKAPDRRKMILSGETDAAVDIFFVPLKLVKAGKMKFLALSSGKRNPAAPDVPTARELGMDMEFDLFRGISVAKGTPQPIKNKLEAAGAKVELK